MTNKAYTCIFIDRNQYRSNWFHSLTCLHIYIFRTMNSLKSIFTHFKPFLHSQTVGFTILSLKMSNKYARSGSIRFHIGNDWYVSVFGSFKSVNMTIRRWKTSLVGDPYPYYFVPYIRLNLDEYWALKSNCCQLFNPESNAMGENGDEIIFDNNNMHDFVLKIKGENCSLKKGDTIIEFETQCMRNLLGSVYLKIDKAINKLIGRHIDPKMENLYILVLALYLHDQYRMKMSICKCNKNKDPQSTLLELEMQPHKNRFNKIFERSLREERFHLSHLVPKFLPYLEDNYFESAEKIAVIQEKIRETCDILNDEKHDQYRTVKPLSICIHYWSFLY